MRNICTMRRWMSGCIRKWMSKWMDDLTEDDIQAVYQVRNGSIWIKVGVAVFFLPDLYSKTSMLSRATYIYTYSGDAPMDAGWINLLCMRNYYKPKQINGMNLPKGFGRPQKSEGLLSVWSVRCDTRPHTWDASEAALTTFDDRIIT